jgi:F-type H+-transporting ATPase subunit delta
VAGGEKLIAGVAGRYASALFELAQENGSVAQVRADLERFDGLVAQSDDLQRLLRSPAFSAEEQGSALDAVLQKAGIGGLARNFLSLVAAKRRLFAARDMVTAFGQLADQADRLTRVQVTLAAAPSEALKQEITGAVAAVAGGKVALDVKVDPAIIGGIVITLGSRMVDASLRTRLNSIRTAMKEVG